MSTVMTILHPSWCARTENPGEDHSTATLYAAAPSDGTDIRLRLQELHADDLTVVPMLFLEFVDDEERDERYSCPLFLPQAKLLVDSLNTLLTTYQQAQEPAATVR